MKGLTTPGGTVPERVPPGSFAISAQRNHGTGP